MSKHSPRRRARQYAVQALYQSALNDAIAPEVAKNIRENMEQQTHDEIAPLQQKLDNLRLLEPSLSDEQLAQQQQVLQKRIQKIQQQQQDINELFTAIFFGASRNHDEYMELISPLLDRDEKTVHLIEKSVLLMAVHELKNMPETPYRVVINEAIEVTKTFGGVDGHKFVNGILDKLADTLRPHDSPQRSR